MHARVLLLFVVSLVFWSHAFGEPQEKKSKGTHSPKLFGAILNIYISTDRALMKEISQHPNILKVAEKFGDFVPDILNDVILELDEDVAKVQAQLSNATFYQIRFDSSNVGMGHRNAHTDTLAYSLRLRPGLEILTAHRLGLRLTLLSSQDEEELNYDIPLGFKGEVSKENEVIVSIPSKLLDSPETLRANLIGYLSKTFLPKLIPVSDEEFAAHFVRLAKLWRYQSNFEDSLSDRLRNLHRETRSFRENARHFTLKGVEGEYYLENWEDLSFTEITGELCKLRSRVKSSSEMGK